MRARQWSITVLLCVALGLVLLCSDSPAGTIVSVTDSQVPVNRAALFLGGQFSNVVAVSWMQTAAFSNITIDASLVSTDNSFRSGTAYLMNAIGPGTTPASEVVAPADFTAPVSGNFNLPVPLTVLFTGLNLGPGTYYLVLSAPHADTSFSPLYWQIASVPVVTTAVSATIGNDVLANTFSSTVDPFPPASRFISTNPGVMFDVNSVPEPETSVLSLISFATLILYQAVGGAMGVRRSSFFRALY
jgi:hypothetical protein